MNVVNTDDIKSVNVNGIIDKGGRIRYLGEATKQPDGTWRCLADVDGNLCVVQVIIKLE